MKRFIEFLEELEHEDEKRVFNGGGTRREPRIALTGSTPVFSGSTAVNEDGGGAAEAGGGAAPGGAAPAVGGDVAPSAPHCPNGAPGGILAPGSDCMMPTVINGHAPSHGHHHGHRPPPPPHHRPFPRLPFVFVLGTKKKKSKKKSKKHSQKHSPKNPY